MAKLLRLLLVEDSEDDAALVEQELRRSGYEPFLRRVETPEELEAALSGQDWDVILSDHNLPRFSGLEALRLIKRLGVDVPFILVSGAVGEEQAVAVVKAGAHDYVLKSNLARLGIVIERELREAEARREHGRAQEALLRSEERYRTLFHRNPAGIYSATLEGRIVECNEAFARIYGFAGREEATGSWADSLHPRPEDRRAFVDRLRDEGAVINAESEGRRRDGTPVWVVETARLVPAENGGPPLIEGTLVDVTERKLLEERLRQAQKMEAVGQLAGGIAHDFNNLLSVICGYADLARRRLPPGDPVAEKVSEIGKAGERAGLLTRQLLTFSRRQVVARETLDLSALLTGLESMLRRLIREDIDCTILRSPLPCHVQADRGELEQVVMNLAINAQDAMPQGGQLVIETAPVHLDDAYCREHAGLAPGPRAMLAVTDSGTGMDAETRARVFEPFFTTKGPAGTGLGLATVHRIVQDSGGSVDLWSEPGRGSAFRVYLPLAAEQAASAVRATDEPPHGSETILLVEDQNAVRRLGREMLENLGYRVLDAPHGLAALEVADAHSGTISLLITDVIMPRLGGRKLAEELERRRPGIRVLYTSGYTGDAIGVEELLSSSAVLLSKPFTLQALARKVRDVLNAG